MLSRNLLAGISLLAFAAGAANAQTANINDEFVRGNGTNESNCTPEGTPGNEGNLCTITIDGMDEDSSQNSEPDVEGASGNYADSDFRGDFNVTTIDIFGDDNSATINIRDNTGETGGGRADADDNFAMITIGAGSGTGSGIDSEDNSASIVQRGDSNSSTIMVGSTDASYENSASTEQYGDSSLASIMQDGSYNSAFSEQYADTDPATGVVNSASIVQDGSYNSASNEQYAANSPGSATGMNSASIVQEGTSNEAFNDQDVRDNATSGSNMATITQTGTSNYADSEQDGVDFDVNGFDRDNTSTISQTGGYNDARTEQWGEGNDADVTQNENTSSTNYGNLSQNYQFGSDNQLIVSQTGNGNSSSIAQGSSYYYYGSSTVIETSESTDNYASVVMNGRNMSSVVLQNVDGNDGGGNYAEVDLGNNASVMNTGFQGNSSTVVQETDDNIARVILRSGEGRGDQIVGLPNQSAPNTSTILQTGGDRNEAFVSISSTTQTPDMNISSITQNGEDNYADVTIAFGTEDPDPVAGSPTFGRQGGNTSTILQTGEGNTAVVAVGQQQQFFGLGNSITITQTESSAGNQANNQTRGFNTETGQTTGSTRGNQRNNVGSADRASYYEFGSASADRPRGNFTGSRGHYAETYNYGRFDTVNITQNDDGATGAAGTAGSSAAGRTYTGGEFARARAGVYQSGYLGLVNLTQNGDNYAEITQGQGGENRSTFEGQSSVTVTQTDAGDTPTNVPTSEGGGCNESGCVPAEDGSFVTFADGRQFNQALVAQYGDFNSIAATQNTRAGYLSAYQRPGTSRNLIQIEQGTGSTNASAGLTGPYENSPIGTTSATGSSSQNLTATVEQAGNNNAAQVQQDGTGNVATVLQLGNGVARTGTDFAGFGATNGNTVIVRQQGTNNRATGRQHEGVTRSLVTDPASGNTADQNEAIGEPPVQDDFYFSGGARSPEIDIFQSGTGNRAEVDQFGRGQYAQVFQGSVGASSSTLGNNNVADIYQAESAWNATAVIRQTGNNNSFYIVQVNPGSYVQAEQVGTNNSSNNTITRTTPGDLFGFSTQPTP